MAKTTRPNTTKPTSSAGNSIISLKVTLRGTKPPAWRRLLVPGGMTLGDLHRTIQPAIGWHDCHLHAFEIDGRQCSLPTSTGIEIPPFTNP